MNNQFDLTLFKHQNELANEKLDELIQKPRTAFTMSVPAKEESDHDLVIARALNNADKMIALLGHYEAKACDNVACATDNGWFNHIPPQEKVDRSSTCAPMPQCHQPYTGREPVNHMSILQELSKVAMGSLLQDNNWNPIDFNRLAGFACDMAEAQLAEWKRRGWV